MGGGGREGGGERQPGGFTWKCTSRWPLLLCTTYNKSSGMDSNMVGNYIRNWNYIVFVSAAKRLSFTVKKVRLK